MKCMCDSGLVIVLFITLALLCCVAWLLFSDFSGPCDQASAGTTVSSLLCDHTSAGTTESSLLCDHPSAGITVSSFSVTTLVLVLR